MSDDIKTTPVVETTTTPAPKAEVSTSKPEGKAETSLTYDQLLEKNANVYSELKETRTEAKNRRLENERLAVEKAQLAKENADLKVRIDQNEKAKIVDSFVQEASKKGFDPILAKETAPQDLTAENMDERLKAYEEKWKHLLKPAETKSTHPLIQPASGQSKQLTEMTRADLLAASIERTNQGK